MIKSKYFESIIKRGLNIQPGQIVEIVTSVENAEYIEQIIQICKGYNPKDIIITYKDGIDLENKINNDPILYLDEKVKMYQDLIENNFIRLNLISPFSRPLNWSDNIQIYLNNINKLGFLYDYLSSFINQHTSAVVPNLRWAEYLGISLDDLWLDVINMCQKASILDEYINEFSKMDIDYISFKTSLGTDLRVGLLDDSCFLGKSYLSKNKVLFEPNIPCLEIYTAPHKKNINGVLVSSKDLYYKGKRYSNIKLEFEDGYLVNNNIKGIINDESLKYAGEIALVLPNFNRVFATTILDENLGCHLALGNSIKDSTADYININHSNYHIDIIFGTNDIDVEFILKDKRIIKIINKGEFVYGNNGFRS